MPRLSTRDSDFRHPGLTYLDFKLLDMERVLTAFLARLQHAGFPSRLDRNRALDVATFVSAIADIERAGGGFRGFVRDPEITHRWIETDLVDMVNRGLPTQAVAGLRPLHGLTYQFRNSNHSRPYGADEHLYEMLHHAPSDRGRRTAIPRLKEFFFAGTDPATGVPDATKTIDVETQALLHLSANVRVGDRPDRSKPRRYYPPFCPAHAELLVDDVLRLLRHEGHIPRSVMVEYLKILFAFHLGQYHLRLVRNLPGALRRGTIRHHCHLNLAPTTPDEAGLDCEYGFGLFVDVGGTFGTPAALLATRSAQVWQQRIPAYIRSAYEVKKLDEFAEDLRRRRRIGVPQGETIPLETVFSLPGKNEYRRDLENFFSARLTSLLEHSEQAAADRPAEVDQILDLVDDDFTRYIEILVAYKGDFHRRYLNQCLDSLLLKNRPGALLAQPPGNQRRFVLDSRLLEVLLQIALLRPTSEASFRTEPLRVDEFLALLRRRYGLYVDRLPDGDGFGPPSIDDHAALRDNVRAFTARLREIGYYSDLSDAYFTQTIRPRYVIGQGAA